MTEFEDVSIHVAARIRPCPALESSQKCIRVDPSFVWLLNDDNEQKQFEFDTVLGEKASQSEVFQKVALNIVDGSLNGYNGTIFAYGQTNSGKTYTVQGADSTTSQNFDECKGIIPRAVEHLFYQLGLRSKELGDCFRFKIRCSFIELYNEQIFDLISSNKQPRLRLANSCVHIENVHIEICSDAESVLRLIEIGSSNRRVAETKANRQSSRSHSIFIIHVETEEHRSGQGGETLLRKSGRLNFVDLAGAERLSYTKTEVQRMKESIYINKSLTTLGRVIRALSKKWAHVPYRDSVLTNLLADSIGGNSKTAFILTLHPDKRQFDTTASSLQFSKALRQINHKVWMNRAEISYSQDTTHNSFLTNVDEQLSSSKFLNDIEVDDDSTEFESIEQLTRTLDTIERDKQAIMEHFNRLSLKEVEVSRKLNVFKNSSVVLDTSSEFTSPSIRKSLLEENQVASCIHSLILVKNTNTPVRRSRRRQTIFNAANRIRPVLVFDFQNENSKDRSLEVSIIKTPDLERSNNSSDDENNDEFVTLSSCRRVSRQSETSIPDEQGDDDRVNLTHFSCNETNRLIISEYSVLSDSQHFPAIDTEHTTPATDIEHTTPATDTEHTTESVAKNTEGRGSVSVEDDQEESTANENIDDASPDVPEERQMVLRRKSKTIRAITRFHSRKKRRVLPLLAREVIARAVRAYRKEIFAARTSRSRRREIWGKIGDIFAERCPEQQRFDAQGMQSMWQSMKTRALRLNEDNQKDIKMNRVDDLVLSIVKEIEFKNKARAKRPPKPQVLVNQAEFVQRMMELKLMPLIKDGQIIYRQMNAKEMKNPKIIFPTDFNPTRKVLKELGNRKD